MADIAPSLVGELIGGLWGDFPDHVPGTRPIHAVGIAVTGEFRASRDATEYCVAEQFQGRCVPATVRFSNGNGQPDPDGRLQVRGMAVKLHVGDRETDLVCMTVPVFMVATAERLLDFEKAVKPKPVRRPSYLKRVKSLLTMCPLLPQEAGVAVSGNDGVVDWSRSYPQAQGFIVASSMERLPASYARDAYHAVHAFDVEGADGVHRMVRFAFEPAAGVRSIGPPPVSRQPIGAALHQDLINTYGSTLPADYLRQELRERLAYAPVRFNLRMQIADPWDDTADPTTPWPTNRRRVLMGTLTLTGVVEDQETGCEQLSFNPGRLLPGMGFSDDPVLRDRAAVYAESYRLRMAARGCPVQSGAAGAPS